MLRHLTVSRATALLLVLVFLVLVGCARQVPEPPVPLLTPANTPLTVEVRVSSSTDDAEERATGTMYLSSSDLELTEDDDRQAVGIRFNGVGVPKDAVITNAYVQFTVDESRNENPVNLQVRGEASDSAATFTAASHNITLRPMTLAEVAWSPPNWNVVGEAGAAQKSPDLKAVIQEIVGRPGWSAGNSLALVITGTGKRVAESYNGKTDAAPLLHVEYSTDGAPPPDPNNQPPTVDAGDDKVVTRPASVELNATVTDDGFPNPPGQVSVTWSKVSGPGDVTFGNTNTVDTTASFSAAGTYVLRLTANDGQASAADEVSVVVNPAPPGGGGDTATFEARVASSTDDAEESESGAVSLASSDLELTLDGSKGHQTVGMRFNGVSIPQDAVITNAYVQFTVDETEFGDISLTVRGQASDSAATFASTSGNISTRPTTSASVAWSPTGWTAGASGADQRTPNLRLVIQEIVGRPGWSAGNSLALVITGTGKRVAESYNGKTDAAPLLHVEYSTDGAPPTQHELTVTKNGSGAGTVTSNPSGIDCGTDCSEVYDKNTSVTLTATAEPGSSFAGWAGACSGTGSCTVTMNAAKQVTATFNTTTTTQYTLAVTKAGSGGGTVTSSPAGIDCGNDCSEAYAENTSVTLSASAAAGSTFAGWSGDCSGTGSCTVTMNRARSVTATFNQEATGGTTTLEVRVATRSDDAEEAESGAVDTGSSDLELTFDGSKGHQLVGMRFNGVSVPQNAVITNAYLQFTVDETQNDNPINLLVRGQASDNAATFASTTNNLSTRPTTSAGVAWSPPNWVSVGAAGAAQRTPDLKAVVQEIVSRPGWAGGNSLVLLVSGTGKRVAESYVGSPAQAPLLHLEYTTDGTPPSQYTLTVAKNGTGSGTVTSSPAGINCGSDCSEVYSENTVVNLTASAAAGSTFAGWSGDCSGTGTCTVTMGGTKNVTATFDQVPTTQFQLTVTKNGAGTGTVTSNPAGINCGSDCSELYDENTSVTLTATPGAGSTFAGWSGGCSGTGSCTVTMNAAKQVTATFNTTTTTQYTLAVTKAGSGGGTVTSSPAGIDCGNDCSEAYAENTSVTLSASAAAGSTFAGWSGDCSGTGSCTVTMNRARSVTATFNQVPTGGGGNITSLTQVNHFEMGWTGGTASGTPMTIPSTDAAGIVYHPPTGHLFIADSEINEISSAFSVAGGNIFEISLDGTVLYDTFNVVPDSKGKNREPTGIAYCPESVVDGHSHDHFHISHDNTPTGLWLYELSGGDLNWEDQVTSPKGRDGDTSDHDDPEDVTCDPNSGLLYVVNGVGINILVYSWSASYSEPNPGPSSRVATTHYKLERTIDLFATAGDPSGIPSDGEGIFYDPASGRLFVTSDPDEAIFEYTTDGVFIRKFNIGGLSPRPIAPQGLTLGPSSNGSGGESFYLVDGGIDNDSDPNERDAAVYELAVTRSN